MALLIALCWIVALLVMTTCLVKLLLLVAGNKVYQHFLCLRLSLVEEKEELAWV